MVGDVFIPKHSKHQCEMVERKWENLIIHKCLECYPEQPKPQRRQLKLFVLEDDPTRIRAFCKWFGNGLGVDDPIFWDCIHTCEWDYEFVPPYDCMFLDCDLGGRQMEAHPDSGVGFVEKVKSYIPKDTPIIVHSFNKGGAEKMLSILKDVSSDTAYMPFGGADFMNNIRRIQDLAGLEVTF